MVQTIKPNGSYLSNCNLLLYKTASTICLNKIQSKPCWLSCKLYFIIKPKQHTNKKTLTAFGWLGFCDKKSGPLAGSDFLNC